MTEIGELRIRLVQDDDSLQEIFAGGYSDIPDLQKETEEKVRSGEWNSYIVLVEKAVAGGWENVDELGGTVTTGGYEGVYSSLDAIRDEDVRNAVSQVWETALTVLRENTSAPAQSEVSWPLGRALGPSRYDPSRGIGVLGHLTKTASGNTVLEVGNIAGGGTGWLKSEHIVLTPAERERLIADLIAQREN